MNNNNTQNISFNLINSNPFTVNNNHNHNDNDNTSWRTPIANKTNFNTNYNNHNNLPNNTNTDNNQNNFNNKTSPYNDNDIEMTNSNIRNMNMQSNQVEKTNWKKAVSDKLVRRIMSNRENRINYIRFNNPEISNELWYDEMISDNTCDQENAIFSYYYNQLEQINKSNLNIGNIDIESVIGYDPNISICPICNDPVISSSHKIICLNLCFEFNIRPGILSDEFTIDNFIDMYKSAIKNHQKCMKAGSGSMNSHLQLIELDDGVNFLCVNCL